MVHDPSAPTSSAAPPPETPSAGRMVLVMGSVGFIAAVLLVATYLVTLPIIQENRAEYLAQSIKEVLPGAVRNVAFVVQDPGGFVPAPAKSEGRRIFAGYDAADSLIGLAVEAQGQGYADIIRVLYGFDPVCRCVVGLKVLESKETPGLGDKIQKDANFVANFERLEMRTGAETTLELVKNGSKTEAWQIEAITGATVSSRAITDLLAKSTLSLLPVLDTHLEQLKTAPPE
jgi:Na+-translocating ferredoxin:NAD+ oxidoreductase subunit G